MGSRKALSPTSLPPAPSQFPTLTTLTVREALQNRFSLRSELFVALGFQFPGSLHNYIDICKLNEVKLIKNELWIYYFVGYPKFSEASYFADQSGVFEVATAKDPRHGNVMQQVYTHVRTQKLY